MRRIIFMVLACIIMAIAGPWAGQTEGAQTCEEGETQGIILQIGEQVFPATLFMNQSSIELMARMPMILDMKELNGNEKYYYFGEGLPAASEAVGAVQTGDLMLYGADCLVLFYKNFATPYSYTRLGIINNTEGLAEALGKGTVTVMLEVAPIEIEGEDQTAQGHSKNLTISQ